MDTRNKRSSAVLHSLPWRGLFPAPDGTLDNLDRAHIVFLYAFGVSSTSPTPTPGGVRISDYARMSAALGDATVHTVRIADSPSQHQVSVSDKDGA